MALKPGKLYYSISEVSKHFDVAASLLRYWESEFNNIKPKRNTKGTRFYAEKDIEQVQRVYHLVKEKGYTIKGAKSMLKGKKTEIDSTLEVTEKLQNIRNFLTNLRDNI